MIIINDMELLSRVGKYNILSGILLQNSISVSAIRLNEYSLMLKKQIQMVAEGSVLYAESVPRGSAADVAPDGFAHPVFRAGFALSIRLPEVH